MGAVLTPRQRDELKYRIARAIAWSECTPYARSEAERLSEVVIAEMERSHLGAAAQRRAVLNLAERLEKSA